MKMHFIKIKEQLVLIKQILEEQCCLKDLYGKKGSFK